MQATIRARMVKISAAITAMFRAMFAGALSAQGTEKFEKMGQSRRQNSRNMSRIQKFMRRNVLLYRAAEVGLVNLLLILSKSHMRWM